MPRRRDLLDALHLPPDGRVLDLGLEGRAVSPRLHGRVREAVFVASDIRAVRACAREAAGRERAFVRAVAAEDLSDVEGGFGTALYGPPPREAKPRVFEWIDEAFRRLDRGGCLCLFGRRDRGLESYRKRAEAVFGNVAPGPRGGRSRSYVFSRTGERPGAAPVDTEQRFEVTDLPGGPLRFATRAGAFSRDGFDPGSRLLVETLCLGEEARILDVGCGWGAIGIALWRRAPLGRTRMLDVDVRAVRCARENVERNGAHGADARLSDLYEKAGDEPFDWIVSNPPLHEGKAVAHPLILEAPGHLAAGGRLALVVMRPGPYRKALARAFGEVRVLAARDGYTVLAGSRPRPSAEGRTGEALDRHPGRTLS